MKSHDQRASGRNFEFEKVVALQMVLRLRSFSNHLFRTKIESQQIQQLPTWTETTKIRVDSIDLIRSSRLEDDIAAFRDAYDNEKSLFRRKLLITRCFYTRPDVVIIDIEEDLVTTFSIKWLTDTLSGEKKVINDEASVDIV